WQRRLIMQIKPNWLRRCGLAVAVSLACFAGAAQAQIKVGVIVSTTGPGASLGIPSEQAFKLLPDTLAGQKLTMVVLNDGSDSNMAARNAGKLINAQNVAIIVGSSLAPNSIPVVEEDRRQGLPVITLSGGKATVVSQEGPRKLSFFVFPSECFC